MLQLTVRASLVAFAIACTVPVALASSSPADCATDAYFNCGVPWSGAIKLCSGRWLD